MGIDLSTYVGAYFRCTPTKAKVEKTKRCCGDKTCVRYDITIYDKTLFCPVCGKSIVGVVFFEEDTIQKAHQISHEIFNDKLRSEQFSKGEGSKYHLFLPNDRKRHYVDNKCETAYFDLSDFNISQERLELATTYQKEFAKLQELYSEVVICFGVLCTMN